MQAETLEAFRRMDYALESRRLLVHAIHESRKYAWRTGKGGMRFSDGRSEALASGASPVDVVQQAMALTMDGSRPWNKEKYPDLCLHLRWVIRSLIANLAASADNRQLRPVPEEWSGAEAQEPAEAGLLRAAAGPDADELGGRVLAAVKDDPALAEALGHLKEGRKPRHIAELMGLAEKDVYRLTQKLRRRLAGVLCAGV